MRCFGVVSSEMTQCERIIRHLKDYGTITATEAMQEYGIQRLAARIADIRAHGIPVVSEMAAGKNRYGETTHFAVYRLVEDKRNA